MMFAELLSKTKEKRAQSSPAAPPQDEHRGSLNMFAVGNGAYGRLAHRNTKTLTEFSQCGSASEQRQRVVSIVLGAGHCLALIASSALLSPEHASSSSSSASSSSTPAIDNPGVYSWGKCHFGQLGHGFEDADRWLPTEIPLNKFSSTDPVRITQLAAGDSFSLALSEDGRVWSWGCGFYGALGHGDETSRYAPELVRWFEGGSDASTRRSKIIKISAGGFHAVAMDADGRAFSWGRNDRGQLGLGDLRNRRQPELISNYFFERSAAPDFTECSPRTSDQVQITAAACGFLHTALIDGLSGTVLISGRSFDHACARRAPAEYTQIDAEEANARCISVPVDCCVADVNGSRCQLVQVACGKRLTLALTAEGAMYIDEGGMALEHQQDLEYRPELVARFAYTAKWRLVSTGEHPRTFTSIGCGEVHCAAIDSSGQLCTWGCNRFHKLGRLGPQAVPLPVKPAATKFVQVAGGSNHTIAVASVAMIEQEDHD